ncbi:FAD-binding protein [Maritimibacter sp. DP1N21-5]|uniref:FAD-dependent oxidoreductase n=1 Tax=Maritimibacter sp. DP1N21-5 TaxID=2836867 RepID=UPI001C484869|nr:FAD-binding oxidoreductase [Maritimibacter sp. DP1N21-5]MBV7407975.1 FAD-binding oxidoreductase [Maritimibacter sp. DP1N21-5]
MAITRRALLLGTGAALGYGAAWLTGAKLPVFDGVALIEPAAGDTVLNDASTLSATPVAKHVVLRDGPGEALVSAIRAELREAQESGRPFNIGAARHSMGGQAIPARGHAVTFDNGFVEVDSETGRYLCHAGARWSEVIAALDPVGLSPKVMQSNNDFGVAATYSVNAHGWPVPFGPMGSTVISLRMVLPDGELVTASRQENPELFGLAMGGYGLIGAIVDMEVEAAPNTRLVPSFDRLPAEEYAPALQKALDDPNVTMAYGRLNVERAAFFEDALLITYRESADQADLPEATGSGWVSHAASRIYRWQLGNEQMKRLRWWQETTLGPMVASGPVTRNSLINEPVVTLDDRNPSRVDILHEYFVGFDRFGDFLAACRAIIPASYQEFLNVTLRYVATDAESVLTYAPVPRIAAVMSFSQEMTERGEADMARMTRELVEAVIAIGGTYYLPYRPHPTQDQLVAAYPAAPDFAAAKRALDPGLTLRNLFWDRYFRTL